MELTVIVGVAFGIDQIYGDGNPVCCGVEYPKGKFCMYCGKELESGEGSRSLLSSWEKFTTHALFVEKKTEEPSRFGQNIKGRWVKDQDGDWSHLVLGIEAYTYHPDAGENPDMFMGFLPVDFNKAAGAVKRFINQELPDFKGLDMSQIVLVRSRVSPSWAG